MTPLRIDVHGCARCGGNHLGLEFEPLRQPPSLDGTKADFWAICPRKHSTLFLWIARQGQQLRFE